MRDRKAGRVHRVFHRIEEPAPGYGPVDSRAARMTGKRERENVVPALQHGKHKLPDAPCVDEAMQTDQG